MPCLKGSSMQISERQTGKIASRFGIAAYYGEIMGHSMPRRFRSQVSAATFNATMGPAIDSVDTHLGNHEYLGDQKNT